jgi:tetratricopeptide (TPR) repeat protein
MSLAGTDLSVKDQKVLSAIFGGGEEVNNNNNPRVVVDVGLPPDRHVTDLARVEEHVRREKEAIKLVEEKKEYGLAKQLIDEIILHDPMYASAYNNRAQLLRMKEDADTDGVMKDLQRAIELAQPETDTNYEIRVSKMQGTILCQAYTQLGGIYLALAERAKADGKDYWTLEEKASQSLFYAGMFGNETARALAAKVNPYAKLCGNMVKEALERECSLIQN